MITKRARMQFASILNAADQKSLCIVKCFNIASGKTEFVLCAHELEHHSEVYLPLAKLFTGDPNVEISAPGAAKYKLI